MKRRDFLGAGLAPAWGQLFCRHHRKGAPAAPEAAGAPAQAAGPASDGVAQPRDVVYNIKPVMISMIHSDSWEGPCRWKAVPPSQEKIDAERSFARLKEQIKGWDFSSVPGVRFLEPTHLTFKEDFVITPEQWAKLAADSQAADAYFVEPFTGEAGYQVAERFRKPLIFRGISTRWAHIASYARSKGLECFVTTDDFRSANDIEGLKKLLAVLRARKVFSPDQGALSHQSRPARRMWAGRMGLPGLEKRLGVVVKSVSYQGAHRRDGAGHGRPAGHPETAEQAAEDLLRKADKSYIDRKYVVRSFQFHQTVKI